MANVILSPLVWISLGRKSFCTAISFPNVQDNKDSRGWAIISSSPCPVSIQSRAENMQLWNGIGNGSFGTNNKHIECAIGIGKSFSSFHCCAVLLCCGPYTFIYPSKLCWLPYRHHHHHHHLLYCCSPFSQTALLFRQRVHSLHEWIMFARETSNIHVRQTKRSVIRVAYKSEFFVLPHILCSAVNTRMDVQHERKLQRK